MRDGFVRAVEHAVTDVYQEEMLQISIKHLPQVRQHVCSVAEGYIYGL
jgi:hypothetical protein